MAAVLGCMAGARHLVCFLQVKLETRIPAGFLAGLGAFPMMAGLNLEVRRSGLGRGLKQGARQQLRDRSAGAGPLSSRLVRPHKPLTRLRACTCLPACLSCVPGRAPQSVVERALRERARNEPGGPLVSLNTGSGDLLEVFLEV